MTSFALGLGLAVWGAFAGLLWAALAWLVFSLLERFGPVHGARPHWGVQAKGAVFQLLGAALGAVVAFLFWRALPPLPKPLAPGLAFPLALLVSDFLQYWQHRAEHRWFWRFHAVHHAPRTLCATLNINHFSHALWLSLLYSLPMALLTRDPLAIPAVVAGIHLWGAFNHSPIKLSIGPLRCVLADNRLHRLHHSLEPRHFDKNFGAILNVWDVLFGTICWPAKDEWPETGLADQPEIDGLVDFIWRPFRSRTPQAAPALAPR